MYIKKVAKRMFHALLVLCFAVIGLAYPKMDTVAAEIPSYSVTFDEKEQSVVVSGIPAYDASGAVQYELHGYLNYGSERVETFCYAPSAYPYHVAESQAYIFNWADAEFLLPCSGEYQFTTYLVALVPTGQGMKSEQGSKTTITITLTKKDESTNWGPGLPNTTVEAYDLQQMKGKDKTITIEEDGYTWTICGTDIVNVPAENISLKITSNPENFQMQGVSEFFGDTIASKFSIEYSGEFGFKAMLNYYVGAEYTGKYADLFYVVGDGNFEFRESVLIDEKGMAPFAFTHASDYVIAVTEEAYTGQELNPKVPEPTEEPQSTEAPQTTEAPQITEAPKSEGSTSAPEVKDDADYVQSSGTAVSTEEPAQDKQPGESGASDTDKTETGNSQLIVIIAVIVALLSIAGVFGVVVVRKKSNR